jgi:gas vesicle protein
MRNKCSFGLVGFGLGSLAGLLFAPRTGAFTRARIAKTARKKRRLVRDLVSLLGAAVEQGRAAAAASVKGIARSSKGVLAALY